MISIHTKCPVVDVTSEAFIEIIPVGGERQEMKFTREVSWIQESSTELLYVHGNQVIKTGPEYSDYCGYLDSIKLENIDAYAEQYGITDQSTLILIAKTKIIKRPVLETEENKAENLSRREKGTSTLVFTPIPDTWMQISGFEGDIPVYDKGHELNVVLTYQDIWSSKNSEAQNQQLMNDFKNQWAR
jgi:hypothetical protein